MRKKKITLALLDEIEKSRDFTRLGPYQDPTLWNSIKDEERQRLALLFIKQAESLVEKEEQMAISSYDLAVSIAPNDPYILYQHCLAHFKLHKSVGHVQVAVESLKRALNVDPSLVWVTHSFRPLIVNIERTDEWDMACQSLLEAFRLHKEVQHPHFHWQYGVFLLFSGTISGEPEDYYAAIRSFEKSLELGLKAVEIYFDLGSALVGLARLIGQKGPLLKAIDCFLEPNLSEQINESNYIFELSSAYQLLYELVPDDATLEKGHALFLEGTRCCFENPEFWRRWGLLLKEAGRVKKSLPFLEEAFEKFDKAAKLTPLVEPVLVDWAESLLLAGIYSENVDYLRESHEKLSYALMFDPEDPRLWYLLGSALSELALYFQDPTYLFEAIEKFQQGLSLNVSSYKLWWGLASSYLSLGELNQDVGCYEKSCRFFSQVSECCKEGTPELWNEWAVALLKVGELRMDRGFVEAAVERFDHAIRQHLQLYNATTIDPQWVFNLGCSLDLLGDLTLDPLNYEQAIQILTKVLILDPDYPFAKYQLALAYTHLGEIATDLESFSQALELFESISRDDPEDDFMWNDWGVALIHYGELVKEDAHPEKASEFFQLAEERLKRAIAFGNLQAFYNLACLFSLKKDAKSSLEYLNKALTAQALPSLQDILEDDWLEYVRNDEAFTQFIEQLGG